MRRIWMFAVVLTATTAVVLTGLGASRGPITILGNADFTEENGVLSGSGTVEDPYVIAGWEIGVPPGGFYGVQIENVTAAFVLRGLIIRSAGEPDGAAIRIAFATGGVIEDCSVAGSTNGIEIASSIDIAVHNNALFVYGIGLNVTGESPEEYRHVIAQSNMLNSFPIHYYYGLDGDRIEGVEARHLTVAASRNVTVIGNSVLDGDGIRLAYVTDSTVTANVAGRDNNVPTENGIYLYGSERVLVTANLVKNTNRAGIQLTLSSENEIRGNYLGVDDTGVRLIGSNDNLVTGNEFLGCFTGVWLMGESRDNRIAENIIIGKVSEDRDRRQGIMLDLASGNLIERNALTECEMGITVAAEATHNQVLDNTVVAGSYGIFVSGSYNEFAGNLVTQHSRGILFPETFGRSITRGNVFTENVLANNGEHVRTNLDSESSAFAGNVFLNARRDDVTLVFEYGTNGRWDGNYWGGEAIDDEDGDGYGDSPFLLGPITDEAPLASIDPADLRVGVLGTLPTEVVRIERGDGTIVELDALIAESAAARWTGFRGFPAALLDGFPGILFVFEAEAELRFTMVTVPFDLDIAFFDASGGLVGSATMTALSEDLYTATAPFQYALELASGTLVDQSIGEDSRLLLPATD